MCVLQDHFRTGAADLKRARLDVGATGETNLVHLETDSGLQPHTLFGGLDRLPSLAPQQVNDLFGGNEGAAGGHTGPGMIGEDRRGGAAEIIGRKRTEDAGG